MLRNIFLFFLCIILTACSNQIPANNNASSFSTSTNTVPKIFHSAKIPHTVTGLQYFDGPVLTEPRVYLVYWGFANNDPAQEATVLTPFLQSLGGSQWFSAIHQYYDITKTYNKRGKVIKHKHFIQNKPFLKGVWYDNTNPIVIGTNGFDIEAEVEKAVKYFNNDSGGLYVIALGHGSNPVGSAFTGVLVPNGWCGYHESINNTTPYAVTGYPTDAYSLAPPNDPYPPSVCGENWIPDPNGQPNVPTIASINEGVTISIGHEVAEAISDPNPNGPANLGWGWRNPSSGDEVADLCVWEDIQWTPFSAGSFTTQPLWSNKTESCEQI